MLRRLSDSPIKRVPWHGLGGEGGFPIFDPSTKSDDGQIEVLFRNIKEKLRTEIEQSDVVLGCVAWLTEISILKSLSKTKGISIIIQKEEHLNPLSAWRRRVNDLYAQLPELKRYQFPFTIIGDLRKIEEESDSHFEAIRCVGYKNGSNRYIPIMHNKFLLFCMLETYYSCIHTEKNILGEDRWLGTPHCQEELKTLDVPQPYKVWTGSFNLTKNAANYNFENVLIINNPEIVTAFYDEYNQIVALSESLDSVSEDPNPEYLLEHEVVDSRIWVYLRENLSRMRNNQPILKFSYANDKIELEYLNFSNYDELGLFSGVLLGKNTIIFLKSPYEGEQEFELAVLDSQRDQFHTIESFTTEEYEKLIKLLPLDEEQEERLFKYIWRVSS